jgi:hypothetical protein
LGKHDRNSGKGFTLCLWIRICMADPDLDSGGEFNADQRSSGPRFKTLNQFGKQIFCREDIAKVACCKEKDEGDNSVTNTKLYVPATTSQKV